MILERRERVSTLHTVAAPAVAVVCALAASLALVAWAGAPIAGALAAMSDGAFGSTFAFYETLVTATPLVLTGLAVAVAFQAKLYNIGAEGQLYAGALAASALGMGAVTLPGPLLILLLLAVAAAAGGLLLAGPALLKVRFGVDEVVTTLLLNFVMLLVVSLVVLGPWRDPIQTDVARPIVGDAYLPALAPGSRLTVGILIAVGMALIAWLVVERTSFGYEVKAVGSNSRAAAFTGLNVSRTTLATALIAGGFAGLAGAVQLLGISHALSTKLSSGFGYTGIVVALLARLHPIGVIGAAVFFAAVSRGADNLSRAHDVPIYLSDVIQALALLFMLTALLATQYRVRRG